MNNIKAIIFDLDGVLVDAKLIHYNALNYALMEVDSIYSISWDDHIKIYDGLPTSVKLDKLTATRNLSKDLHPTILKNKQKYTLELINKSVGKNDTLVSTMAKLKEDGYSIACCSNAIRRSIYAMLSRVGIIEYVDLIVSRSDVQNPKPHPEIFWKAMSIFEVTPHETVIVEDSPPGIIAASLSGACVVQVESPADVTYDLINTAIHNKSKISIKWKGKNMNVLIPMAGAGSRFVSAGYTFPKPLIDVEGTPMIQRVVENVAMEANYIFIVRAEHRDRYNLDTLLKLMVPNCTIVEISELTDGAAVTTLVAKHLINNDQKLLIVNSDQLISWNPIEFMYKMTEMQADGGIVTHTATHPKWSFAKVEDDGTVSRVEEKNPISDVATVGIYYWAKGSDYVKYAEQMISKNIRTNNEFYVCPVYNEAIADGKKIIPYQVSEMWGIGTPEDLQLYLTRHN